MPFVRAGMLANVGNGLAYRGWHFMAC
eukprot:COSAG04_NODE_20872_length_384_cov_1.178947_1_plen_26_part_01